MSFERKRHGLAGTLVAALAGCAAVSVADSANAAIVYSGIVNIVVPANSSGVFLNVETGAYAGAFTPAPLGWDINVWGTSAHTMSFFSGGSGTVYMRNPGVFTGTNVARLNQNVAIGAAGSFVGSPDASFSTGTQGHWNYGATNVFGFRFVSDAGGVRYGWMRMLVGENASVRTIVDYAYESSGGAIMAGATFVPGPSAVAIFAIGLARSRRRRD